jgi:DNA polymerase IV
MGSSPDDVAVRVIFHVDMDAFFASVEQLFNPALRGKPVLVCGNPEGRSIVATASYEARPFGIKCGMPVGQARKLCPHGTFVEGDPGKYLHLSLQMLDLLRSVSPRVEPFSIDEAFLDVTGQASNRRDMLSLASGLQRRIRRETGLTASIGIGPNKFIAKMASGVHKPEGLTCLSRADFRRHFYPLPVRELWGVGEATEKVLNSLNVRTIRQLAEMPEGALTATFGVIGQGLKMVAQGEDDSPVVTCEEAPDAKSIGHDHTLSRDESDPVPLLAHLLRLSDQVARRARLQGYSGGVVTVRLRTADFVTHQAQRKLRHWVSDGLDIFRAGCPLFEQLHHGGKVRLVGISLGGLVRLAPDPQELLFPQDSRRRLLTQAMDGLKKKRGEDALVRAGALLCSRGETAREARTLPPGPARGLASSGTSNAPAGSTRSPKGTD